MFFYEYLKIMVNTIELQVTDLFEKLDDADLITVVG